MAIVCPKCGSIQSDSTEILLLKNNYYKPIIPGVSLYEFTRLFPFKKYRLTCYKCSSKFKISNNSLIAKDSQRLFMTNEEWHKILKEQPAYKFLSEILLWIFIALILFCLYQSLTIFEIK